MCEGYSEDMEKSKRLFDKLKEQGECYHEWEKGRWSSTSHPGRAHCDHCGEKIDVGVTGIACGNPDFFSIISETELDYLKDQAWINFGWLWERWEAKVNAGWGEKFYRDWFRDFARDFDMSSISCRAFAEHLYELLIEEVGK